MASVKETTTLKVVIDTKKKRVVFAEAGSDFVDVLFGFLTLPMGTIHRLLPHANIGSFNNLYGSMSNLDGKYFKNERCKDMLLRTGRSVKFRGPNVYTYDTNIGAIWASFKEVFVAETASFIISDDLSVIPNILGSTLGLLEKSGITDFRLLEEKTLELGPSEILKLLECSIVSKTPLADMVFGKEDVNSNFAVPTLRSQISTECINYNMKMTMKLFFKKLNNEILLLQTSNEFVDFLFSFLLIPLGRVVSYLSNNCASTLGIANIHQSILDQNVDGYLKSQQLKEMLLNPQVARYCICGNPIFLHNDVRSKLPEVLVSFGCTSPDTGLSEYSLAFPKCKGGFVMGHTMYMVTDDLVVTPISSTSCISYLQSLDVLPSDVEEQEISIGMEEAMNLLIACLSSTSVLNNSLKHLIQKKPKQGKMLKSPKQEKMLKRPRQEET